MFYFGQQFIEFLRQLKYTRPHGFAHAERSQLQYGRLKLHH